MKKSIVLLSIAIVVVGMMAGLRIFVSEEPYDAGQSAGEALMEMEHETDRRVESLQKEIETEMLSQADCQVEVKGMMKSIIENLLNMKDGTGSYINMAYNCNVMRRLGLRIKDDYGMAEAGLKLRRDNLSLFSDKVFSYALDVSAEREEEADYLELSDWAQEIEANLDEEVERYTKRLYAWYGKK